jgi:hypothetical protein
MHLDRRLAWAKYIITIRKQLNQKAKQMHRLLGRRSTLSTESRLLLYKAVLKPIWTYGIQLWATASISNISIQDSTIHSGRTLVHKQPQDP